MMFVFTLFVLLCFTSIDAAHLRHIKEVNHTSSNFIHPGAHLHRDHNSTLAAWIDGIDRPYVHSTISQGRRLVGTECFYDAGLYTLHEVYRVRSTAQLLRVTGYPLNTCICSGCDGCLRCTMATAFPLGLNGYMLTTNVYEGNYCTEDPTSVVNTPLSPTVMRSTICNTNTDVSVSYVLLAGSIPQYAWGCGVATFQYNHVSSCQNDLWSRYEFFPSYVCFCSSSAYIVAPYKYQVIQYSDRYCWYQTSSQVIDYSNAVCTKQKSHASAEDEISLIDKLYYASVQII
eukprot:scaffold5305_cov163-Ochromonas_danica.AAC.1